MISQRTGKRRRAGPGFTTICHRKGAGVGSIMQLCAFGVNLPTSTANAPAPIKDQHHHRDRIPGGASFARLAGACSDSAPTLHGSYSVVTNAFEKESCCPKPGEGGSSR